MITKQQILEEFKEIFDDGNGVIIAREKPIMLWLSQKLDDVAESVPDVLWFNDYGEGYTHEELDDWKQTFLNKSWQNKG